MSRGAIKSKLPRPCDVLKPVASLNITIPIPPPLNNLFINVEGKGRVKSAKYRAWEKAARDSLMTQGPLGCVRGKFGVDIYLAKPKQRTDLDGRAKAALDLLVNLGLVEDDSLCDALTLGWDYEREAGQTQVLVWSATA